MNQGLIPAKWARLTPGAQAIYDSADDRRVTWGDFDELVRRLANGLLALGLTKGSVLKAELEGSRIVLCKSVDGAIPRVRGRFALDASAAAAGEE